MQPRTFLWPRRQEPLSVPLCHFRHGNNDAKGVSRTYHIKSGQGFLIFPGQINTYIADQNLPWEYTWIEFDGLRVKEALELTSLSANAPVYHARYKELREQMMNEMLYIVRHPGETPYHLIGHLYLFLDYLSQSMRSATALSISSPNRCP